MPKTNTDTILANPCRHCPSSSPTKCRYHPTRLKYALTEHFDNNLVCLKTRPRLISRRPFAQSAIELMESFAGMSLSQVDSTPVARGVEEVRGPTSFASTTQSGETPTLGSAALRGVN